MEHGISIGSFRAVLDDPRLKQNKPEHLLKKPRTDPEVRKWNAERKTLHEIHAEAVNKSIRSRDVMSLTHRFVKMQGFI